MTQLAFALPRRRQFGRSDFFVSASNAEALAWIDRWPLWPGSVLVLWGPPQSGKTHLAHLWAESAGGEIRDGESLCDADLARLFDAEPHPLAIDEAERAPESALFHLYNHWCSRRAGLLLIAEKAPQLWPIALPDLSSRLEGALSAAIGEPDDALLAAVLLKHFADRQLRVAPAALSYLLARMTRSFKSAASLAARLDEASLEKRRAITVPLVRRILAEKADHGRPSDFGVS